MTRVEVTQDGFVVDAEVIAEAFGLEAKDVQPLMRSGEVTSVSETGVGEDAGRSRITFRYNGRTLRLVVDTEGTILKRSSFPSRSVAEMFPIPAEHKPKATS